MTPEQLEILLRSSLELWGSDARLQAVHQGPLQSQGPGQSEGPLQARLVLRDGVRLTLREAAPDEAPFRWWLLWTGAPADDGSDGALLRRKPCASTLGLLRSLREGLGTAAAGKLRIGTGAGPRGSS